MQHNYLSRDCPSCSLPSANAKLVAQSRPPAEELEFDELKEFWRGFRKNTIFFSYYRCSGCGLLYCPTYFNSEQLNTLYSRMEDNSAGEDLEILKRAQLSYLSILRNRKEITGHWVEVGADMGFFAEQLANCPHLSSLSVIEPNLNSHTSLQRLIKAEGVLTTSWTEIEPKLRFDGLVGIHVLDHLVELKAELSIIHNHLKSGGTVFFVTHNESSFLRFLLRRKWPPFCLHRPQIFNRSSIGAGLQLSGFCSVRTHSAPNFFSVRHIFSVLISLLGLPRNVLKFVPNFTLKLRLGNFATSASKS